MYNQNMKKHIDIVILIGVTAFLLWQREILYPVDIALFFLLPILLSAIKKGRTPAF